MTQNDKELLRKAAKINDCSDWCVLARMAEKADSEEVRERLDWKSRKLYHDEEYYAGLS